MTAQRAAMRTVYRVEYNHDTDGLLHVRYFSDHDEAEAYGQDLAERGEVDVEVVMQTVEEYFQ